MYSDSRVRAIQGCLKNRIFGNLKFSTAAFWDVTPCRLVNSDVSKGLQGQAVQEVTLKMQALRFFDTSVNIDLGIASQKI